MNRNEELEILARQIELAEARSKGIETIPLHEKDQHDAASREAELVHERMTDWINSTGEYSSQGIDGVITPRVEGMLRAGVIRCAGTTACPHVQIGLQRAWPLIAYLSMRRIGCTECFPALQNADAPPGYDDEYRTECDLCLSRDNAYLGRLSTKHEKIVYHFQCCEDCARLMELA